MTENSKTIIGFKFFDSEEEFVKWQLEKSRKVFSISPFMGGLGGTIEEQKENKDVGDLNMQTRVRVFVTYEYDISN